MTLRWRLLLGYGYLVALLLLATGAAVLGFLRLSAGIDRVLDENYRSIRVAMDLLESLERQDSETLSALLTDGDDPGAIETFESEFRHALESARSNVTEERESEVLDGIERAYAQYRLARDELLAAAPDRPLAAYNRSVFPAFVSVKRGVRELLDINQEAMVAADREAKSSALRSGAWLGFVVALALLSLVFLSRAMQRYVLSRLDRLRHEVARMAAGRENRRLRDEGEDELGAVARGINALLDRHQTQEGEAEARLARERRILIALVETCHADASLYDLSGRLRAGRGTAPPAVVAWIRDEGKRRIEADEAAHRETVEGHDVRLLAAGPDRPAGWLVTPGGRG
jgi:HAMP domain-containing protein